MRLLKLVICAYKGQSTKIGPWSIVILKLNSEWFDRDLNWIGFLFLVRLAETMLDVSAEWGIRNSDIKYIDVEEDNFKRIIILISTINISFIRILLQSIPILTNLHICHHFCNPTATWLNRWHLSQAIFTPVLPVTQQIPTPLKSTSSSVLTVSGPIIKRSIARIVVVRVMSLIRIRWLCCLAIFYVKS